MNTKFIMKVEYTGRLFEVALDEEGEPIAVWQLTESNGGVKRVMIWNYSKGPIARSTHSIVVALAQEKWRKNRAG